MERSAIVVYPESVLVTTARRAVPSTRTRRISQYETPKRLCDRLKYPDSSDCAHARTLIVGGVANRKMRARSRHASAMPLVGVRPRTAEAPVNTMTPGVAILWCPGVPASRRRARTALRDAVGRPWPGP